MLSVHYYTCTNIYLTVSWDEWYKANYIVVVAVAWYIVRPRGIRSIRLCQTNALRACVGGRGGERERLLYREWTWKWTWTWTYCRFIVSTNDNPFLYRLSGQCRNVRAWVTYKWVKQKCTVCVRCAACGVHVIFHDVNLCFIDNIRRTTITTLNFGNKNLIFAIYLLSHALWLLNEMKQWTELKQL